MPWRLVTVCGVVGVTGGAIFGFIRGLDHVPTLPFAIVEGAILFGVPCCLVGLLSASGWWLATNGRRRFLRMRQVSSGGNGIE
jgi:hypothetical protein